MQAFEWICSTCICPVFRKYRKTVSHCPALSEAHGLYQVMSKIIITWHHPVLCLTSCSNMQQRLTIQASTNLSTFSLCQPFYLSQQLTNGLCSWKLAWLFVILPMSYVGCPSQDITLVSVLEFVLYLLLLVTLWIKNIVLSHPCPLGMIHYTLCLQWLCLFQLGLSGGNSVTLWVSVW